MKKIITKLRSILEPPELPSQATELAAKSNTRKNTNESKGADSSTPEPVQPSTEKGPNKSSQTTSIEQLWESYEAWLAKHFEESLAYLNPGVSEDHLLILERSISNTLPDEYRAWLKTHNGQATETTGLLHSNEFLSVSRLLEEWLSMKKLLNAGDLTKEGESVPKGAIKPVWWDTQWLPISADGSGGLVCIDLAPSDKGVVGQIINFDHKTDQRHVLANSFSDYIAAYLSDLEAEKYRYSKIHGKLLPLKDC